jgi:hypothetical protein
MHDGVKSPIDIDMTPPPVVLGGETGSVKARLKHILSRIEQAEDLALQEETARLVGIMPSERLDKVSLMANMPYLYNQSLATEPASGLRAIMTLHRYRDGDGPLAQVAQLLITLMHE